MLPEPGTTRLIALKESNNYRSHELLHRRRSAIDPAHKYRKLLTVNLENLSIKQVERRKLLLESDPELGVIYGNRKHVRELLKTWDIHDFKSKWALPE